MDVIILGSIMCQHRVTNPETEEKRVQIVVDTEEGGTELYVSFDAARFYSVGTKVSLTLEVVDDATH